MKGENNNGIFNYSCVTYVFGFNVKTIILSRTNKKVHHIYLDKVYSNKVADWERVHLTVNIRMPLFVSEHKQTERINKQFIFFPLILYTKSKIKSILIKFNFSFVNVF